MSVEFSEHKVKLRYKFRRTKFPLLRLVLLGTAVFLFFYLGFFSFLWEKLPLSSKNNATLEGNDWRALCQKAGGTPLALEEDLIRCSWLVKDSMPLLPNGFLRYVAWSRKGSLAKLHWVAHSNHFDIPLFVQLEDENPKLLLNIQKEDSSFVWIDFATGCRYPGPCPQKPLNFSSLSITENFDFDGQETLLAADMLRGVGGSSVYPVLPGRILKVGRDSSGYFVEIDHGNNVSSRMWGMNAFVTRDTLDLPRVGKNVTLNTMVGRLAPVDSASFFLRIRRNGAFVRWDEFYKETHPLDSAKIAKFKEEVGL